LIGFSNLPENMRKGIEAISESIFINTNYSFNKAVESTYNYALGFINESGGIVSGKKIKIKIRQPVPPDLEVSFPNLVFDSRISVFDNAAIKLTGKWKNQDVPAGKNAKWIVSGKKGDEIQITFKGSGISITGNWVADGGKADIYLDGALHRTIDTYYNFSNQQHMDVSIWHAFGLKPGTHSVKIVVNGEKRSESAGTNVYISEALIFKTEPKKSDNYKFSFE